MLAVSIGNPWVVNTLNQVNIVTADKYLLIAYTLTEIALTSASMKYSRMGIEVRNTFLSEFQFFFFKRFRFKLKILLEFPKVAN